MFIKIILFFLTRPCVPLWANELLVRSRSVNKHSDIDITRYYQSVHLQIYFYFLHSSDNFRNESIIWKTKNIFNLNINNISVPRLRLTVETMVVGSIPNKMNFDKLSGCNLRGRTKRGVVFRPSTRNYLDSDGKWRTECYVGKQCSQTLSLPTMICRIEFEDVF